MNKTFRKIAAKIILGASLGIIGTTAIPTTSAFASQYSQSNLSMQSIYRQDGYVIAQVNASPTAVSHSVYMVCESPIPSDYKAYEAPFFPGTWYDNDGTECTVTENGANYLVTFKINMNVFSDISKVKARFENESFGGQNYTSYKDDNGGKGYTL